MTGYLELEGANGRVELDGSAFTAHFPNLYRNTFSFDQASGTVAWNLDRDANEISILSGPLRLDGALGEVNGQFMLSLPVKAQSRPTDLVLALSLHDAAVTTQEQLVPTTVSKDLRGWLNKGLGAKNSGRVESAAFIYRGSSYRADGKEESLQALGAHRNRQTIQLAADFTEASLKYAEEWPSAKNVDGRLLLNDGAVSVGAVKAKLWNIDASDIFVAVAPLAGKGSRLDVQAQLSGPAADGLRLLRESPLRQQLGSGFDDWHLAGNIAGQLNLTQALGELT
ncbi:DUF3971 domain-containing protein [Microbulbifer sp. MLAF003]|uniref:YhdP family protein n=1 Tax=Microbulbifer sp. MLAF003 TaxID=3032582 RepID=UPI0024AE6DDD|nr:DUF3971 domain-containing protein [Microbulbifer sp. MLAF003]WHI52210.1 DUF3971 domain-containing protein [Microbulbifer sp. MLAF003]